MGTFVVVELRVKLIRRRLLDVGTMQEKDQYKSNSIPGRRSEHEYLCLRCYTCLLGTTNGFVTVAHILCQSLSCW